MQSCSSSDSDFPVRSGPLRLPSGLNTFPLNLSFGRLKKEQIPPSENKFQQRIGDLSSSKIQISRFYMDGEVLHSVGFLGKRHWTLHVDLWLVAIIYGVWLISIGPRLDALILCSLVALQILISLFGLDLKGFLRYSKVNDIHQADACKVILDKFSGSKGVVPLQKMKAEQEEGLDKEEGPYEATMNVNGEENPDGEESSAEE
ncbi:unnamed protein product [Fraxinus pennsylvanica]|uniref:Uncharacterized protein n=1 Tax=Fraxinus pennsylvanica TaxID=56036 RepID=A0AAD1ZU42_9LAMI|nr:unnamed protein product [Fraxinus pennsylvanica]